MRWLSRFAARIVLAHAKDALSGLSEKCKRLEIERTEILERLEVLEASHHRLLKRYAGRAGGRPTSQDGQLSLDQIPQGDKDSLRRYFAPEIARRGPGSRKEN